MRGKMFLTFVAAACVFFAMGLGSPAPNEDSVVCKFVEFTSGGRKFTIRGYTTNCTCEEGGKRGQYPDGTMCRDDKGHIGNCTQGVCNVKESTYGCAGKNGSEPKSVVDINMCTFECVLENGKKEWGYSPDGTPCVNLDNVEPINGTCKHREHRDKPNETVCFPNNQMHLLGC
uniref:Putative secreted protein n=1 Tax=Amblyomma cajennense TaxID=34607 RepID=A0A023FQE7_AMBCJ